MFEFEVPEKVEMFRRMAREFSQTVIRPAALQADLDGRYPDDLCMMLAQAASHSGGNVAGADRAADAEAEAARRKKRQPNLTMVILTEELSWGDPCACLNIPGPGLGGPPVQFAGTPAQKERFLGIFKNMTAPRFGAYATTEPGCGSDVSAIATTARKTAQGWVLNGTKCFITNGGKADWTVIFATVDKSLGRAGQRMFVVERTAPGFSVGKIEKKMGLRASETAEQVLEDCEVDEGCLLGGEEHYAGKSKEGFKGAMKTFDATRPLVAAMAVGIAQAAYEIARDFVREHYLVGRPIARYRTLAEHLATMHREIEAARMLTWRAAWLADQGLPNTKEASMCKVYSAGVAQRATQRAIEIMGPYGVLHNRFVEKLFRDQKVYDIFEGTGQAQRIVISRRLFDKF